MNDDVIEIIDELGRETLNASMIEFQTIYKVKIPYVYIPTLEGPCYFWDPITIANYQLAMSTDKLTHLSKEERETWEYFVNFENYHSTSARETDANGMAIGCTIPNEFNESFVVGNELKPLNGKDGRRRELCQPPGYEVQGETIWKSLDAVFMAIYNCEKINDCNKDDQMNDISPCPVS